MLEVVAVGKIKNKEIRALCDYYKKLSSRFLRIKEREVKRRNVKKELGGCYSILLDENGEEFRTLDFLKFFEGIQHKEPRIKFVVGDDAGFNNEEREKANFILSLSKLTFPHEIARLLLFEQLYRIFTIIHRHPYHRG